MSEYSTVHTTGKTAAGGWMAGLRSWRYQAVEVSLLATLPRAAVAPVALAVQG